MRGDQLARQFRIVREIEASPNRLTETEIGISPYLVKFKTLPSSGKSAKAADRNILNPKIPCMFRGMTGFILATLVKTGTTVQSLKYSEFELQPFPLPPIGEQQRIVAKVDELMALCDELESRQKATATTRRQLLEATLSEAIAP